MLVALGLGLGYSAGLVRSIGGTEGLWWHIAVALTLVPLLLWHLVARWVRPRRTDLSRRVVLRAGALGLVGGALYGALVLLPLPGMTRRFTGSYEVATGNPAAMPNVIWLNDTVPSISPRDWQLNVVDAAGGNSRGATNFAPLSTPPHPLLLLRVFKFLNSLKTDSVDGVGK